MHAFIREVSVHCIRANDQYRITDCMSSIWSLLACTKLQCVITACMRKNSISILLFNLFSSLRARALWSEQKMLQKQTTHYISEGNGNSIFWITDEKSTILVLALVLVYMSKLGQDRLQRNGFYYLSLKQREGFYCLSIKRGTNDKILIYVAGTANKSFPQWKHHSSLQK